MKEVIILLILIIGITTIKTQNNYQSITSFTENNIEMSVDKLNDYYQFKGQIGSDNVIIINHYEAAMGKIKLLIYDKEPIDDTITSVWQYTAPTTDQNDYILPESISGMYYVTIELIDLESTVKFTMIMLNELDNRSVPIGTEVTLSKLYSHKIALFTIPKEHYYHYLNFHWESSTQDTSIEFILSKGDSILMITSLPTFDYNRKEESEEILDYTFKIKAGDLSKSTSIGLIVSIKILINSYKFPISKISNNQPLDFTKSLTIIKYIQLNNVISSTLPSNTDILISFYLQSPNSTTPPPKLTIKTDYINLDSSIPIDDTTTYPSQLLLSLSPIEIINTVHYQHYFPLPMSPPNKSIIKIMLITLEASSSDIQFIPSLVIPIPLDLNTLEISMILSSYKATIQSASTLLIKPINFNPIVDYLLISNDSSQRVINGSNSINGQFYHVIAGKKYLDYLIEFTAITDKTIILQLEQLPANAKIIFKRNERDINNISRITCNGNESKDDVYIIDLITMKSVRNQWLVLNKIYGNFEYWFIQGKKLDYNQPKTIFPIKDNKMERMVQLLDKDEFYYIVKVDCKENVFGMIDQSIEIHPELNDKIIIDELREYVYVINNKDETIIDFKPDLLKSNANSLNVEISIIDTTSTIAGEIIINYKSTIKTIKIKADSLIRLSNITTQLKLKSTINEVVLQFIFSKGRAFDT